MTDKETGLGLEIRQKLNIAKMKEMHKDWKEQRHTEEQRPGKKLKRKKEKEVWKGQKRQKCVAVGSRDVFFPVERSFSWGWG